MRLAKYITFTSHGARATRKRRIGTGLSVQDSQNVLDPISTDDRSWLMRAAKIRMLEQDARAARGRDRLVLLWPRQTRARSNDLGLPGR